MKNRFSIQWESLVSQFHSGKASHAYLFSGSLGMGKLEFVNQLTLELLGAKEAKQLLVSPDYFQLSPELEEKNNKIRKKKISIEKVREVLPKLYYFPSQFKFKILLIDEIESMTNTATNALLKLIEEPPEKTVIFAITHNETRLLATIRSRFSLIRLRPVTEINERPGLVYRLKGQVDQFEKIKETVIDFRKCLKGSFGEKSILAKEVGDNPNRDLIFDEWLFYLKEFLFVQISEQKDVRIIYKINGIIEEILKLKKDLQSSNANPRLRIEQFFLSL